MNLHSQDARHPFYYEFEASALMAFAVLAEELLFECARQVESVENDDNEKE